MKLRHKLIVATGIAMTATLIIFAARAGVFLPNYPNDLDAYMENERAEMEIPGMAAGIVTSKGLTWEGTYGTYDGTNPVTEDTVFMIASVSKTIIATALMQLWEQGLVDLDADINTYLDFDVRNPNHPDVPITIRHLMIHRSSITDRYPFYTDMYTIEEGGGDSPWELGPFLEAYLVPGGEFYSEDNYLTQPPGLKFDYSNYGAALLARLVEILSGEDYAAYCNAHIFRPLGMDHTTYLLRDLPEDETVAVPFYEGEPLPHYNYPDYPAGSLRTTVRDLSRFAAFHLDPANNPAAILQPGTVDLMFGTYGKSSDLGEGEMGLIWVHMGGLFSNATGHTGGDPGVSTALLLYPEEGFGTILFLNGNPRNYFLFLDVADRLHDEARLIP